MSARACDRPRVEAMSIAPQQARHGSNLGAALHELDRHPLAGRDVLHELAHAERAAAHIPDLQRTG